MSSDRIVDIPGASNSSNFGSNQGRGPFFYVVVNKSLPIETQLCQVAHACVDAGREFQIPAGAYVAVLQAKNEIKLMAFTRKLVRYSISHIKFREPDLGNALTAICTDVVTEEQRHVFRKLLPWVAGANISVS